MKTIAQIFAVVAACAASAGCAAIDGARERVAGLKMPSIGVASLRLSKVDPVELFLPEAADPVPAAPEAAPLAAARKPLGRPPPQDPPPGILRDVRFDPEPGHVTLIGGGLALSPSGNDPFTDEPLDGSGTRITFDYERPEFMRERDNGTFVPLDDDIIVKSRRTYQFEETGLVVILEGAVEVDAGLTSRLRLYRKIDP